MIKECKITNEFKKDLQKVINRHCIENALDMPDYIIANHICNQIEVMSHTLKQRDAWFSVDMWSEDKRLKLKE